MDAANAFLLLQINDALFPIGGYSHSYGLETYIQKNLVADAAQARDYIEHKLDAGFLTGDFLAMRLAWEAADARDTQAMARLDAVITASKAPAELRSASLKLGSRFIKTVDRLPIPWQSSFFVAYCDGPKGYPYHHAGVYGAFCASVGIGLEEALTHFLYAQTSAMVTACVKSIPLSQTDGQKILYGLAPRMKAMVAEVQTLTAEDLFTSAPGFDIRSMEHEALYSRIYMS